MFKTIACLSTLAALALTSVAPAHAYISMNGGGENGVSRNGGGENGTIRNGMSLNGGGENAVAPNGIIRNGTSLKGGVFAIDGIELPAAR